MKCKLSLLLTSLVLSVAVFAFNPIVTRAAVTPSMEVIVYDDALFLTNTYVSEYEISSDGSLVLPEHAVATYQGYAAPRVHLTLNEGCYYTGSAYFVLTFKITDSSGMNIDKIDAAINLDSMIDGVSYSIFPDSIGENQATYQVRVQFENFEATQSSMYLPFAVNITAAGYCDNTNADSVKTYRTLKMSAGGETFSDVMEWDDLTATPGFEGDIAYLVQTVINENVLLNNNVSMLNTNLLAFSDAVLKRINQQTTSLTNFFDDRFTALFDSLDVISANEIEANNANHEEQLQADRDNLDTALNGYDDENMQFTAGVAEDSFNMLENAESSFSDFGTENIGSFTISETGITGYANGLKASMSLVSSMMQSIYSSAIAWNIVIIASFTLTICAMLTGLFKFFRE